MSKLKTVRPATTNGIISAASMVIALAKSGCPLEGIKLYREMDEAGRAQVRAALA